MIKEFLTVKEVAKLLKLNTLTVYDYIRAGKLKAVRFGRTYRIQENDFSQFVNAHQVHSKRLN